MITQIDHIEIIVNDVKEYVEFYQKLGFKLLQWTDHHGGSAELQLPGPNQPIFEIHTVIDEENIGVNHIAFKTDDLLKTYEELKKEGIEFSNEPFERVFVAPYIPRKKLWGALDSYGEGVRAQDVVVLIDDTVFGGAREGIWITETQIRSKAKFEDEDVRLLGLLSDITVRGAHIRIHGEPYATLSIPNFDDLQLLFGAINAYLKEAH